MGVSFYNSGSYYYEDDYTWYSIFTLGVNIGYKFVTRSSIYFRTGSFVGTGFGWGVYVKPDVAIGWTMR